MTELVEHYNTELEDAGWTMGDTGNGGGAAWSTWTFSAENGETWGGTLLVLESPTSDNLRQAMLTVAQAR